MEKSIVYILTAIAIAVIISITVYNQLLGNNENDYSIVCVYGHEYYRASFVAKGFLGIKLDDNGKPITCK